MRSTPRSKPGVSQFRYIKKYTYLISPIAIVLPTQTIGLEKEDGTPTTKRKLTFDNLIANVKHYSAGARKGQHKALYYTRIERGLNIRSQTHY